MEEKKDLKVDLESRRSTFLLLAYIVAVAALYVALEWNYLPTEPSDLDFSAMMMDQIEENIVLPPMNVPKLAPPPPSKEVKREITVITLEETETKELVVEKPTLPVESVTNTTAPEATVSDPEKVYQQPDLMPEFPGGVNALLRYINSEIKFPTYAKQYKMSGTVICSFIINRDGSVSHAEVVKGAHRIFDEEALRVLSSMPKWKPGEVQRRTVKVRYTIPIIFRIQ